MEAFIVGKVGGAAFDVLDKVVMGIVEDAFAYPRTLARVKKTVIHLRPTIENIDKMSTAAGISSEPMKAFLTLMDNATTLITKCSQISKWNLIHKVKYKNSLEDIMAMLKEECDNQLNFLIYGEVFAINL